MIKIVYDYKIFTLYKYSGITRYFYELATRTAQNPEFAAKILAGFYINKYLGNCPSGLVKGWQIPTIPITRIIMSEIMRGIDRQLFNLWLDQDPPNLVHETYYSQKRTAFKKYTTVITVHDMIHEKFSATIKFAKEFSLIKATAIKRADHIFCISENTKQDLVEILDINPKKITTIYLGHSLLRSFNSPPNLINHPYILYVGERIAKYKNFKRLLHAYASSKDIKNNFHLVCFGYNSFSLSEILLMQSLNINLKNVIHLEGDDQLLASLYAHAAAFIYPSLYEGFGIPPLEAMSFNCPVVCSNTSSIPEVVGNAGEYFNPYEVDNIAGAIAKVLFSSSRTAELINYGKERITYFSWQKCAEQTQLVYKSLL